MTTEHYTPIPWWVWTSRMNFAEMRRQLKLMKETGIQEFFIFPNYGLEHPVFLSDDWWKYIDFTIQECKRLGLVIWIYDDMAWPSGTAAGHVLQEHPEYRMKIIACNPRGVVPGGSFTYSGGGQPLELLLRTKNGLQPVSLDANGQWHNTTGGIAELLCLDIRFYNGVELGCMRAGGTWNQRGYIDMMNPQAVRCWMGYIHERYKEKFGREFGKTIRGFFFDEPTLTPYNAYFSGGELMYFGQGPCIPYTPGLFEKFRKRTGYDLPGRIHSIFYDTPDSTRVRCDFWNLTAELMALGFGKTVSEWCTKNHLLLTGHSNSEEPSGQRQRILAAGDIYRMQKYQHIPGADLLFYKTPFRGNPDMPFKGYGSGLVFNAKLPGSIARYSGAKRAMVEAFGVRGGNGTMAEQKDINNFLGAMGVSLINDNTLTYIMPPVDTGKSFTQPWFKHYNLFYQASENICRFAAFGHLDTEIAMLLPETAQRAETPFQRDLPVPIESREAMIWILDALLRSHLDFELFFEDLLDAAPVKDGVLSAPNSAFRILLFPNAKVLSEKTSVKLSEFCASGGKLLFVNSRPQQLIHRPLTAKEKRLFESQPLLMTTEKDFLRKLRDAITRVISPKYTLQGDAETVVSALRVKGSQSQLFLANLGENPAHFQLKSELGTSFHAIDTDTGDKWSPAPAKNGSIPLALYPEQSLILVPAERKLPSSAPVIFQHPTTRTALKPEWNYRLLQPNCVACKLEFAPAFGAMAENPSLLKEWIPVDRSGLQDSLLFSPREYPFYWVRTEFTVQGALPQDLEILLPDDLCDTLYLNGKRLPNTGKKSCVYNQNNRTVSIAGVAKSGKNTILARFKTDNWYSLSPMRNEMAVLSPIVLRGAFAARIAAHKTILSPLPKTLHNGDIAEQGLPQYAGEIVFSQEIRCGEAQFLQVTPLCAGSIEATFNGKTLGVRAWQPYIFALPKAKRGTLAIHLTTAWGNLLPATYQGRIIPAKFGIQETQLAISN